VRIRHEGYLRGSYLADERYELRGGVALDIKLGVHFRLQVMHVRIADMPLVWTWVHSDAICPEPLAVDRDLQEVGYVAATCVS